MPECIDYDAAGSRSRAQVEIASTIRVWEITFVRWGEFIALRAPEKQRKSMSSEKWIAEKVPGERADALCCSSLLARKEGQDEMEMEAVWGSSDADIA